METAQETVQDSNIMQDSSTQTKTDVVIVDAINNSMIAETTAIMSKGDIWALDNTERQLNELLDKTHKYKIAFKNTPDESYSLIVIKEATQFIIVKFIKSLAGRERRRYLRVPCNDTVHVIVNGVTYVGTIKELAYGSLVLALNIGLSCGQSLIVRLREAGEEVLLYCKVIIVKSEKSTDLWLSDTKYILSIDADESGEIAMRQLYGKIYRISKESSSIE